MDFKINMLLYTSSYVGSKWLAIFRSSYKKFPHYAGFSILPSHSTHSFAFCKLNYPILPEGEWDLEIVGFCLPYYYYYYYTRSRSCPTWSLY